MKYEQIAYCRWRDTGYRPARSAGFSDADRHIFLQRREWFVEGERAVVRLPEGYRLAWCYQEREDSACFVGWNMAVKAADGRASVAHYAIVCPKRPALEQMLFLMTNDPRCKYGPVDDQPSLEPVDLPDGYDTAASRASEALPALRQLLASQYDNGLPLSAWAENELVVGAQFPDSPRVGTFVGEGKKEPPPEGPFRRFLRRFLRHLRRNDVGYLILAAILLGTTIWMFTRRPALGPTAHPTTAPATQPTTSPTTKPETATQRGH